MRSIYLPLVAALMASAGCATNAPVAGRPATPATIGPWDSTAFGQTIDEARQVRLQGDPMKAERLCYSAFETVDRAALDSYDAYATLTEREHRPEAAKIRANAVTLRAIKEQQSSGKQPTSSYLGFSPVDGLKAYADLLRTLDRTTESTRIQALATAYGQVQQAHVERTIVFRQGKDARGIC